MATVPPQHDAPLAEHTGPPLADPSRAQFERIPPQNLDAEQSTLGGMLQSADAIADVVGVLGKPREGIFYRPAHETIYRAVYDMWTDGQQRVDPITVAAELVERGEIARIGGPTYLHTLVNLAPIASAAEVHAEIVRERAKRRAFVEACVRGAQRGYAGDGDTDALVDTTLAEVQALALTEAETPKLSVADRWTGFLDELDAGTDPEAIDSPWRDLNDVVHIAGGQLITVGAATSGGKSLFAFNWATHVALRLNKPVLAFSLEMSGQELLARITAAEARIPLDRLTRRALTEDDWTKIARISDRMANAHNFLIEDNGSAALGHIRARARWMATTGRPPGLIVVDYLQLMEAEGRAAGQNRAQEVASISRGLKQLAMDLRIPIIAVAQFNREAKDRRPQVTDFKESSSIEQDSNVIILLHTELDGEGNEMRPGEIDVIVAKSRQGARGRTFPLAALKHYALLADMAHT